MRWMCDDTHLQWRSIGDEPPAAVGIAMPIDRGENEAIGVRGEWEPTVG